MDYGKDAIWSGPNLWVVLSFFTLSIRFQLKWRSYLQVDCHKTPSWWHTCSMFPESQKKPLDGNKKKWGMRSSEGQVEHGHRWTERGRMQSYRTQALDLVLELGTPAVECIDLRNIGLQVWFLLRVFRRIKVHTMGRSGLIPGLQEVDIIFTIWLKAQLRSKSELSDTEHKLSTCHLFQLHKL